MSQSASFRGLPFGEAPSVMQRLHNILIASKGGIELKSSDALSCSPGFLAFFTSRHTSRDR
eukprot:2420558-Amphidinium_carterae.1